MTSVFDYLHKVRVTVLPLFGQAFKLVSWYVTLHTPAVRNLLEYGAPDAGDPFKSIIITYLPPLLVERNKIGTDFHLILYNLLEQ
jgi:hypothetical protein